MKNRRNDINILQSLLRVFGQRYPIKAKSIMEKREAIKREVTTSHYDPANKNISNAAHCKSHESICHTAKNSTTHSERRIGEHGNSIPNQKALMKRDKSYLSSFGLQFFYNCDNVIEQRYTATAVSTLNPWSQSPLLQSQVIFILVAYNLRVHEPKIQLNELADCSIIFKKDLKPIG